ncbi:hypothetical protein [Rhizohabitans arisaemae]|uniref:hypothetical protein n=1 Tax=Rhizohabitans arisaemae TaxID=2720610 RepID=UPI0024B1CC40|nr:hypothetical protein [Rhizohabitans arisaemae]
MRQTARLLIAVTVTILGLLAAAPAAHAVDPIATTLCLVETATGLTTAVDPAHLAVPTEALHCFGP